MRRDGKSLDLIEVKASTSVKETHIPDVAFQTLVIERVGVQLRKISIGHVNGRFLLERLGDAILAQVMRDSRVIEAALTIAKPGLLAGATPALTLRSMR